MSTDDDDLSLSASTAAALAEFLAEKQAAETSIESTEISIDAFPEDWQLSQFWYDDTTAETLAKELLHDTNSNTIIAILSAPSVYAKIRKMSSPTSQIYFFEYDSRFSKLCPSNFIQYDYNSPLRFPSYLRNKVDRILADPPFLSDECLTRTAMTVRGLKREGGKTMVCTGGKMEELVPRLFPGVRRVEFEPRHKGGLANAFACFMDWPGEYI